MRHGEILNVEKQAGGIIAIRYAPAVRQKCRGIVADPFAISGVPSLKQEAGRWMTGSMQKIRDAIKSFAISGSRRWQGAGRRTWHLARFEGRENMRMLSKQNLTTRQARRFGDLREMRSVALRSQTPGTMNAHSLC
jgi:hypothetical protein